MAGKKKAKNNHLKQQSAKTPLSPSTSTSPLSEQQWNNLAIFCAISSLFLYWSCVENEFVFDDFAAVVQNPDVRGESPMFQLFKNDFWATPLQDTLSNKSFRPLTTLTYRWSHALFGMNPRHFHSMNILLNATCAFLVVKKSVQTMTLSSTTWMFPVVTCLLFTFHPIHTEVVSTVVGRADLLSSIFALWAYLQHSKCIKSEIVYSRHLMYTLVLAWLSALCKETGLLVLGICGVSEVVHVWFSPTHNKHHKTASTMRFMVLASTGVSYLLFRKGINGPSTGILPSAGDNPLILASSTMQYAATAMFIMAVYVWKLIYPFSLLCDYGYNVIPLINGWNDVRNLATLGLVVSVVALAIMAFFHMLSNRRQRQSHYGPFILMALAWIVVPLLPASHVLILGTVVAERLLYLPSLGFCMLISLLLECVNKQLSKTQKGHYSWCIMAMLGVVLAAFTQRITSRNVEWSTTVNLWKADYHTNPNNVKIALAYAADLHQAGDDNQAYQVVKDLEGLGDVQQFEVCALKAKMTALSSDQQQQQHDYDKAYRILDTCVEQVNARTFTNPSQKDHLVFGAYGYLLSTQDKLEQAAEWFQKASDAAERAKVVNMVGPVCNQGEILARMNRWKESIPVLQQCAELSVRGREQDDTKLMNLAKAYYMSRDFDRAEAVLMEEMTQTQEVQEFLETVRSARVMVQEWEEKKKKAAAGAAAAAEVMEKEKQQQEQAEQQEQVEEEQQQ